MPGLRKHLQRQPIDRCEDAAVFDCVAERPHRHAFEAGEVLPPRFGRETAHQGRAQDGDGFQAFRPIAAAAAGEPIGAAIATPGVAAEAALEAFSVNRRGGRRNAPRCIGRLRQYRAALHTGTQDSLAGGIPCGRARSRRGRRHRRRRVRRLCGIGAPCWLRADACTRKRRATGIARRPSLRCGGCGQNGSSCVAGSTVGVPPPQVSKTTGSASRSGPTAAPAWPFDW